MSTTLIARPQVRVPANTCGQVQQFTGLGFHFETRDGDDPIYQLAILPRLWRARGLHPLRPTDIVDDTNRTRVLITYGARPVLTRSGRTVLQPIARMRLVSVTEYLTRAIAEHAPVIPDDTWATPTLIWEVAGAEAVRATRTAAEFEARLQETSKDRYEAIAKQWTDLADLYAPILLESAA